MKLCRKASINKRCQSLCQVKKAPAVRQSHFEFCAASRLTTCSSVRLLLLPLDCWPITIWNITRLRQWRRADHDSQPAVISSQHPVQKETFIRKYMNKTWSEGVLKMLCYPIKVFCHLISWFPVANQIIPIYFQPLHPVIPFIDYSTYKNIQCRLPCITRSVLFSLLHV